MSLQARFSKRESVEHVEEGHVLAPKFDRNGLIPVVTTVLDQPRPALSLLQGEPHISKCLGRHIGMANDIMGFTQKIFFFISTGFNKG